MKLKKVVALACVLLNCICTLLLSSCLDSGNSSEKGESMSAEEKTINIEVPEDGILKIYSEPVREYLTADFDSSYNLAVNAVSGCDPQRSILNFTAEPNRRYIVRASEQEDFGTFFDREAFDERGKGKYNVNLRTLIPGRKYYVKIFDSSDETICSETISFTAEDLTVRTLNILDDYSKGTRNLRDSGGYKSINGKKVVYGMLYRGGYLNHRTGILDGNSLTDFGREILRDELGVRAEIDLRTSGWDDILASDPDKTPQTENFIDPSLPYYKCTITQYDLIFGNAQSKSNIAKIFSLLADEENYPVYIHCNAGADRTGTIYTLIHGILGVSEEDATRDFELTSFSTMGTRLRDEVQQNDNMNYVAYGKFMNTLKEFSPSGDFNEGVENYVKSLGVTDEEISEIRNVLLK